MKADEAALVVGFHDQEDDRGNERHVGQHSRHVVGKSGTAVAVGTAGRPLHAAHTVVPSAT